MSGNVGQCVHVPF